MGLKPKLILSGFKEKAIGQGNPISAVLTAYQQVIGHGSVWVGAWSGNGRTFYILGNRTQKRMQINSIG